MVRMHTHEIIIGLETRTGTQMTYEGLPMRDKIYGSVENLQRTTAKKHTSEPTEFLSERTTTTTKKKVN